MTNLVLSNYPAEPEVLKISLNTMMQRTANENAAGLRKICKGSDMPKVVGEQGLVLQQYSENSNCRINLLSLSIT